MIASPTFRSMFKEKERDVLNLFTVEGEGGYGYADIGYTFMYKGSAFFPNDVKNTLTGIIKYGKIETITVNGVTINYLKDVLRIATGNQNLCILYRNGSTDIAGANYNYPYLGSIMYTIKDTFCPSNYSANYRQILLLNTGELVEINCKTGGTNKKVLLTGVQKILAKNQAHQTDILVGLTNGDVYQVWIPSPAASGGNGQSDSGVEKIDGLNHNDVLFFALGDPPASCFFCKKDDRQRLYKLIKPGNSASFKITGIDTFPLDLTNPSITTNSTYRPLHNMTLTGDEYYVDGMSQEFNTLLLTNKRIIHRTCTRTGGENLQAQDAIWRYGWEKDMFPAIPTAADPIIAAKKIITPTAYTMIIEDVYGKYWICRMGGASTTSLNYTRYYYMEKPIPYTFFDTLKSYLIPIREANK
jgi:hypothetical protein